MASNFAYFLVAVVLVGLLVLLFRRRARGSRPKAGQRALGSDEGRADKREAALRSEFLTKMAGDAAAVERIILRLRQKHPAESLAVIYERAIADWLRDNNRN